MLSSNKRQTDILKIGEKSYVNGYNDCLKNLEEFIKANPKLKIEKLIEGFKQWK